MGTVGPYRLRQPLILVCVGEGDPPPDLVWLRDGEVWDAEMDPGVSKEHRQRNTLVIPSLAREFAGNSFSCEANSKRLTEKPETTVIVSIHMPVQDTRLLNLPSPQTAGTTYEVLCQATGSSPSPSFSWILVSPSGQNQSLDGSSIQDSMSGNLTVSRLNITVDKNDHESKILCVATNPVFLPVTATAKLIVNYPPEVEIYIPSDVSPGRLVEGSDLNLECKVDSRPPPTRFQWTKDNEIISEEQTLGLKNVQPENSGTYRCIVDNVEGSGDSDPVRLSVLYRPTCTNPEILPHRMESDEDTPGVDLRCQVDAKPAARSYRWFFNSSGGSFEIPSAKPLMSFMNYAVSKSGDQGKVLCWATNDVGVQSEPCVFHIVPLGAPHPPVDCDISDRTPGSVEVACKPGFSGGLEQHFVLQVFEMINGTQTLVASNWSRTPIMRVTGLQPNTSYILAVHAGNDRGESPTMFVGGQTESFLPRLKHPSPDRLPVLYIIVAVLCSVMFLSIILSITAACRRHMMMKREKNLTQTQPILGNYSEKTDSEQSEPLMKRDPGKPIERKVSFRDCSCSRSHRLMSSVSNGTLNGTRTDSRNLPVQKTIVRSYSIDKLRARCPTCNPSGNIAYPSNSPTETTGGKNYNKSGGIIKVDSLGSF